MDSRASMWGRCNSRPGLTVRLQWPDGSHELTGWFGRLDRAETFRDRGVRYWSRGPMRPVSATVVRVSHRDWRLHARRWGCRSPDCPEAPVTG